MDIHKIEKGIPLPTKTDGISATFRKMKIGESFVTTAKSRAGLYGTAARFNMKIKSAKIDDKHIRVWRIS